MSRTVMNVRIAAGRRVAPRWCVCVVLLSVVTLPGLAGADVVTDWNLIAELVAPRFGGPQPQSRAQAMVQIAVHDALNAMILAAVRAYRRGRRRPVGVLFRVVRARRPISRSTIHDRPTLAPRASSSSSCSNDSLNPPVLPELMAPSRASFEG